MCEEALSFIERWDSPQTLHYLDPPYPGANQGHYDGYTIEDWQRLCDLLDSIQGSYVLSNYPQEFEPQSAHQRIEVDVITSASGQGRVGRNRDKSRAPTAEELGDRQRTEVLWVCDRSANMRSDLQQVVAQQRQGNLLDLLG
jgi:site-specific DNA-adenine methylase